MSKNFDPSLLYAECRRCGRPVLWPGNTSEALLWLGIPSDMLGADCLLLYDCCPNCTPGRPSYEPHFVRLGRRPQPTAH
jgi:hypothetical protein